MPREGRGRHFNPARFATTERPRCEAMTQGTHYETPHRCPYQIDPYPGRLVPDPALCARHLELMAKGRTLTLIDGRRYDRAGVVPPDCAMR